MEFRRRYVHFFAKETKEMFKKRIGKGFYGHAVHKGNFFPFLKQYLCWVHYTGIKNVFVRLANYGN
jgi:hypothetical protein